jgi:hypothetical protein
MVALVLQTRVATELLDPGDGSDERRKGFSAHFEALILMG